MIGVTPKTFYLRMKNGVFGSDEIQIMIDELHIENPEENFFTNKVTLKVANKEVVRNWKTENIKHHNTCHV